MKGPKLENHQLNPTAALEADKAGNPHISMLWFNFFKRQNLVVNKIQPDFVRHLSKNCESFGTVSEG